MTDEMEKYGVDEENQKTAEEKKPKRCPKCDAEIEQHGSVLICPNCGTEPFEGTPEK